MVLASAKNFETLIVVRFLVGKSICKNMAHITYLLTDLLVGLAESTFYPAIQYVIGSWYKGNELGKRACIFHVRHSTAAPALAARFLTLRMPFQTASALGPMFSGFLQTVCVLLL